MHGAHAGGATLCKAACTGETGLQQAAVLVVRLPLCRPELRRPCAQLRCVGCVCCCSVGHICALDLRTSITCVATPLTQKRPCSTILMRATTPAAPLPTPIRRQSARSMRVWTTTVALARCAPRMCTSSSQSLPPRAPPSQRLLHGGMRPRARNQCLLLGSVQPSRGQCGQPRIHIDSLSKRMCSCCVRGRVGGAVQLCTLNRSVLSGAHEVSRPC